jgi:hypothetical protein
MVFIKKLELSKAVSGIEMVEAVPKVLTYDIHRWRGRRLIAIADGVSVQKAV